MIKRCVICGSEVRGSNKHRYFCKRCNLLFKRRELVSPRGRIVVRSLIEKHFNEDYDFVKGKYSVNLYSDVRFVKDLSVVKRINSGPRVSGDSDVLD